MSKTRLEILQTSLSKKEKRFEEMLNNHMSTVKSANGQPLNDKRNGQATLRKWEKQEQALQNLKGSIEKTKNAIEIENGKIAGVKHVNNFIPDDILELVECGKLSQWRKHPHIFFIPGVDKARIIWDFKNKRVMYRYAQLLTDREQYEKFAKVFNFLHTTHNK